MEKLSFDTGLVEYEINGHAVLRYNPSDLNVYARFQESVDKVLAIENRIAAEGADKSGEEQLALIAAADRDVKLLLSEIFGADNDFDAIFDGVNTMAVGRNGERVVTNFFAALQPIMERGMKALADEKAQDAVQQANMNRAQRRAAARK